MAIAMVRVRNWWRALSLERRLLDSRYALMEAALIGVVSGIAALFLKQGIGVLGGYRVTLSYVYGAWIVLPMFGLLCGWLAGFILQEFSPEASGGGVPQVKAVLAQFPLPLNWQVAIAKSIGTILILGGGLTLGRRGPTVHIGAALAAQFSQWLPTTPDHRRQMIAAGAAAGLAAGFNTPIAGVLFVIEELTRDVSGLTLETAIVASFTGSVVSRWLGTADLNLPQELLIAGNQSQFALNEIPWYLLLGGLAGVLGGIFNRGILAVLGINRRFQLKLSWRMAIAGMISGVVVSMLPPFFRDNAGLRDFLITGDASWQIIAIAFVAHFCLSLLAYGSGAPGGLFAPTLVLGTALGYLVGIGAETLVPNASQYTYALAGMGAFFTGVARVPVTAIVIVFELTADFNLVLPLMLSSVTALIVAEGISKGSIYEHLLESSGIHLEEKNNPQVLTDLTAEQVMQAEVEVLQSDLPIEELVIILSQSHHRGFPVVDQNRLVGILTQSDLAQGSAQASGLVVRDVMSQNIITVPPTASLSDVLYLLNRYKVSRLPVVDGEELLGIITRSDIIRAEARQLLGKDRHQFARSTQSYCIYQTHGTGNSLKKLWVAIANPNTAEALLTVAAAIAREEKASLHCLHVIPVSDQYRPSQAQVTTFPERRLMQDLEKLGEEWQIPIHTQIIIAHDVVETILKKITLRDQGLLLGWQGDRVSPGKLFGGLVETLIRQAPCDVILVKTSHAHPLRLHKGKNPYLRSLLPIAGGPNAQRALDFLPALIHLMPRYQHPSLPAQICLCQVYVPQRKLRRFPELRAAKKYLLHKNLDLPVTLMPIRSHQIAESIIRVVKEETYDVVVLGASRESLLQHALHGNIPEAIAKGTNRTVIIIRRALSAYDDDDPSQPS